MNTYIVEPTISTPYIFFDKAGGLLEIKGRSLPDNPKDIFGPLVNTEVAAYIENAATKSTINISLEYFNTSTSMWLFHLFKKLETLVLSGKDVVVNWYYDDSDILETAEEFKSIINVPFNLIKLS